MKQVIALVQARMGSSRLPGKMMAMLGDHSLLGWVLLRASKAKRVSAVVLATSDQPKDDSLQIAAERFGVPVYRGSEEDVLGRFAAAAQIHKADTVVRICADNPFIDPLEIDRLVSYFEENSCDYACNHQDRLGSRYADGFGAEIFPNKLLQELSKLELDVSYREHVTSYLWDNRELFRLRSVVAPDFLADPEIKLDIDSQADLERMRALVNAGATLSSTAAEIVEIYNSISH